MPQRRVAIQTLGCRLNQADSALIAADFTAHGYAVVPWGEAAEVAVVNSCAVTGVATQKSRHAVSFARRLNPGAFVVLCGCAAMDEKALDCPPELQPDLVVPNPKPPSIAALLPEDPRHCADGVCRHCGSTPLADGFVIVGTGEYPLHNRAYIKIQEGCNFRCTYCIVPQTRGEPCSRDLDDILREAETLLQRGHRELVLTGVNIATYHNRGADLTALIGRLLRLSPHFRVRLGSTEPGPVLDRLIELMKCERRLCRFLHLPVQYGADAILERMGRHYSCRKYADTVMRAVEQIPGVCIGTDLMVGFPGETDELFMECRRFVEEMPFGLMHIFSYSPRPGTPAALWPRPPAPAVEQREKAMLALARAKADAFAASQVGTEVSVLIEKDNCGWSDNYLKVCLEPQPPLAPNTLCECRLEAADGERRMSGCLLSRHANGASEQP